MGVRSCEARLTISVFTEKPPDSTSFRGFFILDYQGTPSPLKAGVERLRVAGSVAMANLLSGGAVGADLGPANRAAEFDSQYLHHLQCGWNMMGCVIRCQ